MKGNGWNDIGYNFLVDRFGTIYEGRFGGVDRNVIGAHALGFNTGSVGDRAARDVRQHEAVPGSARRDREDRLSGSSISRTSTRPRSLTFISGGSERYPNGVPVLLNAVSGHRDTGLTECPGDALYAKLGTIAAAAKVLGGPKIFDPRVDPGEASVRFRARLSQAQSWTVTIATTSGQQVASGAGTGTAVDWTWQWGGQPVGTYRWTVSAGTARPATGVLRAGGGAAPLALDAVATDVPSISPNGDGQADAANLTYRLSASANISVEILDASGAVLATVVDRVWTGAGVHTVPIDGSALVDGTYDVRITARTTSGLVVQGDTPLSVSRVLGLVTATPAAFSPNGDGRNDALDIGFSLTAPATVRVRIERDGRWVASPLAASYLAGAHRFSWDGARATGQLRDGSYQAVVEVDTATGTTSFAAPFVSDTTAPRVRILPGARLAVAVSEPSALIFAIDGRSLRRVVKKAGSFRIRGRVRPGACASWRGTARATGALRWLASGGRSSRKSPEYTRRMQTPAAPFGKDVIESILRTATRFSSWTR